MTSTDELLSSWGKPPKVNPADISPAVVSDDSTLGGVSPSATVAPSQAAVQEYAVAKSGDTMTGPLTLDGGTAAGAQAISFAQAYQLVTGTAGLLQNYNISTTVGGTPAAGTIRYNNASQVASTELLMAVVTSDGLDLTNFIAQLAEGDTMYLQQEDSSANYQRWQVVSAPVFGVGYATITVTLLASSGTGTTGFADALPVIIYGRSAQAPMTTDGLPEGIVNLYFTTARGIAAAVSANTSSLPATENLAAGDMVNIWLSGGVASIRKADNTAAGKEADGFVLAAVTSGQSGIVHSIGKYNTALSGLTIGSVYYLGTTGGVTATAPSTSGNVVQQLGKAVSTTSLQIKNMFAVTV